MSTLLYQHALSGKSVGAGLPLRRASKLYNVEPDIYYPNAFSTGLDSDLHTYGKNIFLNTPHLPITRVVEPYIQNHKAGGGTFTRRQYFVIKRGQAIMASSKREATIGYFKGDGTVQTRTYVDPEKLGGRGKVVGYTNGGAWYRLKEAADAAEAPPVVITDEAFAELPAGPTEEVTDKTDYEAVADGVLTPAEYATLADKTGFFPVYEGLEDTNDKITTGGEDQRWAVEEALFGESSLVRFVEIDADHFYFGMATKSDGFLYPSTGGFGRTIFFNEMDQEAGVTLPTDGTGANPRIVAPIGNVTNVAATNAAAFKDSAVILEPRPTIGFAHTDIEQTTSHRFHMFQTGLHPVSPVRKGTLLLPYVDVVALKATMAQKAPEAAFDFTDLTNGKSGLKVGAVTPTGFTSAEKLTAQNKWSLLTSADAGYANLMFNFAAPFVTTTRRPKMHDKIVPDLFGNFVLYGSGFFQSGATTGNAAAALGGTWQAADVTKNVDGGMTANEAHICGRIIGIRDMPAMSMIKYIINNQFQLRTHGDYLTEGYQMLRSADNAGLEPMLSDFILMTLGGSSYAWASGFLPKWDSRRQALSGIIEDLVVAGVFGLLEIEANVLN